MFKELAEVFVSVGVNEILPPSVILNICDLYIERVGRLILWDQMKGEMAFKVYTLMLTLIIL